MVKKQTLQNLMVIFLFLIPLINCEADWMYYDFSQGYVEKSSTGTKTFACEFSESKNIPYYVKIEVNSTDDNPAPLLCFSNDDETCSSRENLAKNAAGKSVFIWVKREQFMDDQKELYAKVECAVDNCKYIIRFTGDQSASFRPNFIYSYLVTSANKEMRFDILGAESNTYMTVFMEGSRKATINIENEYEDVIDFGTGKSMIFWLPGEDDEEETEEEEEEEKTNNKSLGASNIATIIVKNAEVGEFITISVHLVDDNEYEYLGVGPKDYALPNGPEVSGFIQTGVLNEECFPFDFSDARFKSMQKIYITGRVQTKYGWFFLEDEHRNYREDTDVEIFDGQLSFVMENNGKLNYICFELPFEESFKQPNMAFTFSLSEPTSLKELYNYFPPQMTGLIYRRLIPKGSVAFFSGGKNDNSAKKYDYNLYQIKGLSKLYIAECRFYPDCHYSKDSLENLIEPKNTNQMTIWTTTEDKSSAIGSSKYVMVVSCEDDDNKGSGYCEFETSIFSKGQDIILVENEKFSRFALKGEKGTFVADLQSARKVQRITFDIMIFSGDVNFELGAAAASLKAGKEEIDVSYQKYYLSNKIHFYVNLAQLEVDQVTIDFAAEVNSFFTIQFNVNSYNLVQTEEIVPSGENYLVQIDPTSPTKTKKLFLQNFRYKNKNPFLANFFALNCQYEVKRGNDAFSFFDGYAQEVLTTTSSGYESDSYEYTIKITDSDLSNYNHKMCMLYVSGIESEKNDDTRGILIGENINNQIIFERGLNKVLFVYPLSDSSKDLALHFNVIDKAFYKLTIIVDGQSIKTETVTRTQIFYLRGSVISLHCESNQVCPINIKVEYTKPITKTDPMVEITLREIKNTPTYLQKGQAKRDFVCGDRYYYLYTDVGKNEEGEIIINFLREFGNIWAKVVRKDQGYIDEEANWRGTYRMPSKEWEDSLPFNEYTKTMKLNIEDTQDCIEGCYLLISIQVSQIGEYVDDSKFYPFSIITRINPSNRAYTDIPKVVIQVDEFIIGNVKVSENERISQFYEVWLPHDDEAVIFDWQSSVAGLYINLGGTRPTTKNADFKLLPPGRDSILTLTKQQILDKAKEKKVDIPAAGSIQDVNLVIGIWTDKSDSIDTELYSLRIHQTNPEGVDKLDITEINTDQKILCKPTPRSDGYYRCLFMIIYDDEDVDLSTPIFAYTESTSKGASNFIYADFVDRKIYNEYLESELTKAIPTYETASLNGRADGVDYIYVSKLEEQKYLYINVVTDEPEDVMIVTSMPVYNYLSFDLFEFNPNPNTEQLLACSGEQLRLVFPGTESVMVNIIALNGHAEVYWKNDPKTIFSLRGAGDRISMSSGKSIDQLIIKKRAEGKKLGSMEDPGFAFYISYHERNPKLNYDEIDYGKSIEVSYKDTDLPIVIYSKILDEYRDINVAITFRDNEIDEYGEYESSPLFITAQLVREDVVYVAKKDPELAPPFERGIMGNYDAALKTAQIFLNEDMIQSFGVKPEDNPTLYISVIKATDFRDDMFDKFSIEAQVSGVNDAVIPVEKVYHYGRVRGANWGFNVYRLKVDKNRPFLRVQVAFNSENLDFYITNSDDVRENCTFHKVEKARGKVSVTIIKEEENEFYNLVIFKRQRTTTEMYLNNYAFKYINAKSEDELFDYPIKGSPDIKYVESKEGELDIIKCTFNRLEVEPGTANVTYFLKVVNNSTYIYGEDINTVAVTESPYYTVYKRNPSDENGEITLTAQGDLSNWVYLNVIAQVQQNNVLEYVAYNGIKIVRPPVDNKGSSLNGGDNTGVFIAVGIFLLLIVIGLVAAILIFQMKNKKLLNQVKQVSFQKTNSNSDPLLQSQNNINN